MRLSVESGPDTELTVEADREIVIGRGEDCDLVLHDEQVSRHHASITPLPNGRAMLVDLGSSNGTLVNGVRADGPVEIDGDERIRIGDTVLAVRTLGRTVLAPLGLGLRIESGEARGRHAEATGEFTIGRDLGCDLVLADPTVSARHAAIAVLAPESGVLTDLGSRNGTFVNGRQIYEPVLLSGGERVRLGDTVVSVVPRHSPRAATAVAETGAWLTIESGPQAGTIVKVTGDEFVLGRGAQADLVLEDSSVSSRHAALRVTGLGRASITDLGSRNGTLVDGVQVRGSVELRGGERLQIGDMELRFGEGALEEAAIQEQTAATERTAQPAGRFSTAALARACVARPWLTIAAWAVVFLAGGGLAATQLTNSLTSERGIGGNPESKRADVLLRRLSHTPMRLTELVIVRSRTATVSDRSFRAAVERLRRQIEALGPGVVVGTQDYYQHPDPALVSDDKHGVLIPVVLAGKFDTAVDHVPKLRAVVERAGRTNALQTSSTGEAGVASDSRTVATRDLHTGESIGLAVAFVVLLTVFGTLVAAVVPVLMAVFAIGIALGLAAVVAHVIVLSIFVTNMTVGMGFALGIDYSLFVLTRFREERARGSDVHDAIETAAGTSGGAVLFSGTAVVLALVGMALVQDPTLRSLGIGAILVGATSVLAALTLLPAWLALLGDRVERLALPFVRRGGAGWEQRFWRWVAELVMRRPVPSLLLAVTLLVAAAIPVFDLHTGSNGVTTLPGSVPSRQGFEVVQHSFPSARSDPAQIVIAGQVGSAPIKTALTRLKTSLRRDPAFGRPQVQLGRAEDLAVVSVPVLGDPKGVAAVNAVGRLRHQLIPSAFKGARAEVLVTGTTASDLDYVRQNSRALPFVLVFVLGLSFVLLMVAFRSIVVPTKAVLMNLLSVGAAYGLLVLVFEKGFAAHALGFQQVDRIEAWVPVFLFAVLFGLSMDYHVFLLSRIRERFNETGDNRGAVAHGVTSTARIITGAALIMVAVFGGFALGDLVPFQQLGFGMGVALLLDATVIRSVLVPAGMRLLGTRNWYLPRWLRWLPELNVEGASPQPLVRVEPTAGTKAVLS